MNITPHELKERRDRKETLALIDVREPWEHAIAQIEGSILIPLNDLPHRLGELDPETPIVLYCHHGIRSLQAAAFLKQNGFPDPKSLSGGIDLWSQTIDPSIPRYH